MGNPGLPDLEGLLISLSLYLFPLSRLLCSFRLLFHPILPISLSLLSPCLVTVYASFVTRIVMSLFCFIYLSLSLSPSAKSSLISIFLRNVDLNATFKGKFSSIREEENISFWVDFCLSFSPTNASSLCSHENASSLYSFLYGVFSWTTKMSVEHRDLVCVHFVFTTIAGEVLIRILHVYRSRSETRDCYNVLSCAQ